MFPQRFIIKLTRFGLQLPSDKTFWSRFVSVYFISRTFCVLETVLKIPASTETQFLLHCHCFLQEEKDVSLTLIKRTLNVDQGFGFFHHPNIHNFTFLKEKCPRVCKDWVLPNVSENQKVLASLPILDFEVLAEHCHSSAGPRSKTGKGLILELPNHSLGSSAGSGQEPASSDLLKTQLLHRSAQAVTSPGCFHNAKWSQHLLGCKQKQTALVTPAVTISASPDCPTLTSSPPPFLLTAGLSLNSRRV